MTRVVFFLGAGASRCAGGPLIADFVRAVELAIEQGAVPQLAAEAFRRLRREARETEAVSDNIEELLKRAVGAPEPDRRETLRLLSQAIGAALESRISFSYASGRLASSDNGYWHLAMLLRDLADRDAASVGVVTVNYDVCADVAIMDAGRRCYYCLNPDQGRGLNGEIAIAKIHGSLNWHGCVGGGCGRIWADPHIADFVSAHRGVWPDDPHHHLRFAKDDRSCDRCGHVLLFPLIVPPVPDKTAYGQQMKVLWDNARRMLREADLLVLAGYSCADIDRPVNDLIRDAGEEKRVLIANQSCEARERTRCLLPTATFLPAVADLAQAVEAVRHEVGPPSRGRPGRAKA
jgi:NAD-dependent SIR2 family protein deacetylase